MPMKPLATIHIKSEVRTDGTVYISSDDLPGLWLWGKDHDLVYRSIIPTIEELYKHGQGRTVKAKEAPQPKSERWFGQNKMSNTFEVYPVAQLSEHTLRGT